MHHEQLNFIFLMTRLFLCYISSIYLVLLIYEYNIVRFMCICTKHLAESFHTDSAKRAWRSFLTQMDPLAEAYTILQAGVNGRGALPSVATSKE